MRQEWVGNGSTVVYEDVGEGPAVVLLHNGGTSRTIWRHQIDALAADHRVVALDLPGYGESNAGSHGVDLAEHVALVTGLLDHLGCGPATLVGNCMGSAIAARVAARAPERVRGLVLVNPLTTATFRAGRLRWLLATAARWPRAARRLAALAPRVGLPVWAAQACLALQFGPQGRAAGLSSDPDLVATFRRPTQVRALLATLQDLPGAYGPLPRPSGVPLIVLWGTRNAVLREVDGALTDAADGEVITSRIEGSGHLLMLETPDVVTRAIRSVTTTARRPEVQA